jgi:hypothetical protein
MNPYERAALRFANALSGYNIAKDLAQRMVDAANDEYEAAHADLRQYESQPGIALPEYRSWNYERDHEYRLPSVEIDESTVYTPRIPAPSPEPIYDPELDDPDDSVNRHFAEVADEQARDNYEQVRYRELTNTEEAIEDATWD